MPLPSPDHCASNRLILDTNIVLDMLLFKDPQALQLQTHLQLTAWQWIATEPMRDELAHVLHYAHLQPRMAFYQTSRDAVLHAFDSRVLLVDPAPATTILCRDKDDQKFIDLAISHKATLLSKDKQVLRLRKRLAQVDVTVLQPIRPLGFTNTTAPAPVCPV